MTVLRHSNSLDSGLARHKSFYLSFRTTNTFGFCSNRDWPGFLLFFAAWRTILKTTPASVRYIGIIVAIYSFSENNLDNFPFMSLFILFLSASDLVSRPDLGNIQ